MKRIYIVLSGLCLILAGCSSVSVEQAAIIRSFPAGEIETLKAIETAALAAGYHKINPYEFQRVIRTKHDPILGLLEVSKDMDVGMGFTLSLESKDATSLVTAHPVQIVRTPLTKADYIRTPLKPGRALYAEVVTVIENAKARAEF